ncbi:hypothetical protein GGI07_004517 [Coemansia sp. Benny D115]|nr:hypothetical protein GGI07_004517 [Coemansia sp. Benny D115]
MSAQGSSGAGVDSKKKARDDALQFLETLDIGADEPQTGDGAGAGDAKAEAETEAKARATAETGQGAVPREQAGGAQQGASGGSDDAAGPESGEEGRKDAKGMLKFIDDLTESAKRSATASPAVDSGRGGDESGSAGEAATGWSWGGIWGQAAALVEQNAQLKTGLGKLKESLEQVRNAEASKALGSRVKTLVTQENISRIGGDLKRSLDTVIDTIAPPVMEHEAFSVRLVDNVRDAGLEAAVFRTMDGVFDFHGCGEINLKAVAVAAEMQSKRGDTFTLPKGFDGGYGAAVTSVQYAQHAADAADADADADVADGDPSDARRAESPLFYRAHKTELYLAVQPFAATPIEDQSFLGLCVVLRDPARAMTLRTFSQMLPLSCWAQPRDQIVDVDVDVALGSTVNTATDSTVQRRQEMNEGCLYEAVMLAVKTLSNEYLTTRPPKPE